jgi:hypothetical protein
MINQSIWRSTFRILWLSQFIAIAGLTVLVPLLPLNTIHFRLILSPSFPHIGEAIIVVTAGAAIAIPLYGAVPFAFCGSVSL